MKTKTPIDLSIYDFKSPIFRQISDDPISKMIRVIVYYGDSLDLEFKQIVLKAKTFYIAPDTKEIAYHFTHETKSKNTSWIINNSYNVMLLDALGNPILNTTFDNTKEITIDNLPYKTQPAFDRFAGFMLRRNNPVALPMIWDLSVDSDDANGYFDNKPNHTNLVDLQKEIYLKTA